MNILRIELHILTARKESSHEGKALKWNCDDAKELVWRE